MNKPVVVIGMIGSQLDGGSSAARWETWRPTVGIFQHDDFIVDRLELLTTKHTRELSKIVADDIRSVSPESEVNLHEIEITNPWDFEEVYAAFHEFSRDYKFQPDVEDYLVNITTGTHVAQICLFLLAESRHLPARLLQCSPPRSRRQNKSFVGSFQVIDLDLSRYDRLASRFEIEQQEVHSFLKEGIETRSARFNAMIERVEKVALNSHAPILLTGPTGAGKSRLARKIFELKQQRCKVAGALVEINCAILRGDHAMSSLFGHVKGAFTGAANNRPGLLKSADQGMLFLDEIGELGLDEQAMLLRALEEKRFLPVGSDAEVSSDFQLIAGTNRNLKTEVAEGRFREDLWARINLWTFEMPGLASRTEDIEPNLRYELDRFTEESGRRVSFNKEAFQAFLKFATSGEAVWAANFRDLNAAVTRMATLATAGRIDLAGVDDEIERLKSQWENREQNPDEELLEELLGVDQANRLDLFDRVQLAEVVRVCRASKTLSAAGRELFEMSRQAKKQSNDADLLRKYLQKFGLSWQEISER
jgi:transcriptional regulatory protein RtcR